MDMELIRGPVMFTRYREYHVLATVPTYIGEALSAKSMPGRCENPFTTKRALKKAPLASCFEDTPDNYLE